MRERIREYEKRLKANGASEHTVRAYINDLNQFFDYIAKFFPDEKVDLQGVSKLMVRDFLRELSQKKRCNKTLSRKMTAINNFFLFAVRQKYISTNPIAGMAMPKTEFYVPTYFTEKEMATLLQIPDLQSKFGIRNRAILELMYSSGLRISEVAGCRTGDLDLKKGVIKVLGKGNKERVVPVGKVAIESL